MPSRRKRRRRAANRWAPPVDLTPWLWGAVCINIVLGLLFSPVTAMNTLKVVGARAYDQERLVAVAQRIHKRPFLRVNANSVQSQVLENVEVASASYRANLFGRGVLEVRYRRPVALIEGGELYLSERGAVFASPTAPALRVTVVPPMAPGEKNLSIIGGWQSGAAASMCDNISRKLPDRNWRLVITSTGIVELEPESGAKVILGSFDDSGKKIDKLVKILEDEPGILERVSSLNLSSPSNPVYRS